PQRLADRIAFQLVFKFGPAAVGDVRTWRAVGVLLRRDVDRLKNHVRLVERQIVVALPKLSAQQIEDLIEELRAADPTIARRSLTPPSTPPTRLRGRGVTSQSSTRLFANSGTSIPESRGRWPMPHSWLTRRARRRCHISSVSLT